MERRSAVEFKQKGLNDCWIEYSPLSSDHISAWMGLSGSRSPMQKLEKGV
jgi:hypothetical protein